MKLHKNFSFADKSMKIIPTVSTVSNSTITTATATPVEMVCIFFFFRYSRATWILLTSFPFE